MINRKDRFKMKLMFRRTILFIVLGSFTVIMSGQQVPAFSQYIMNGFMVNPSLAGRDGFTTVNLTIREQWLGVKNAPGTYVASFQSTLLKDSYILKSLGIRKKVSRPSKPSRVGLGGTLFKDNNGIIGRTGLKFDYAYHIPLGKKLDGQDDFSMGLGLVAYQFALNTGDLQNSYADDPYLSSYDKSVFITDFSFGASYTSSKYFLGFSMTNLLRGRLVFGNSADNKYGEIGHYFLTGGFNIPVSKDWSVKPSAFIKSSDLITRVAQMDLTTRVFYKENYWGGISYRTGDAVILLMGLRYDKFYFANSIDFITSDMNSRSFGSVEFTVAMKFGESSRRYRWLNAF